MVHDSCSMIMIGHYIIHYYKYSTEAYTLLSHSLIPAEVSIVPAILISLVLTFISLSGYLRYSTNDPVILLYWLRIP